MTGNGSDPLFDGPADAATVGRGLTVDPATPFFLGTRAGVALFSVTGVSRWAELVPISSVGGLSEATQTWNGRTVRRVGVRLTQHTWAGLVGVSGGAATAYPLSGTISTSYYDVGQVLDGSGAPTGTLVSWSSPGQAWSRGSVASGSSATFGQAFSAYTVYNAAGKDWVLANGGRSQIDLSATMQTPGAAANAHAVAFPAGSSGMTLSVVPHLGGLLLQGSDPAGYLSLDAGATWSQVTVSGTAATTYAGDNGPLWPGQPLFAY